MCGHDLQKHDLSGCGRCLLLFGLPWHGLRKVVIEGMASIRVPCGGVICLVVETVYENGGNPSVEHLSDID